MTEKRCTITQSALLLLVLLLSACAQPPVMLSPENSVAYGAHGDEPLAAHAPVFLVEQPAQEYNRIGAPVIVGGGGDAHDVGIDPDRPQIFAEERSWQGQRGTYTNFIYRIHFREVPASLIPFYLTAGKNVGLLVIVTVDQHRQPLLITTLHTCGCYLAFVPTSYLDPAALPAGWDGREQYIYGETLPGLLDYDDVPDLPKLQIHLRDGVHRVMAMRLQRGQATGEPGLKRAELLPMADLARLQGDDGQIVSFFETEGARTDYVRHSQKLRERLLIGWWAFDWRVGEDKRLGRDLDDGPVFYTSLKPWARTASDLRNFAGFMEYWGWRL